LMKNFAMRDYCVFGVSAAGVGGVHGFASTGIPSRTF
jgi:hypothetical protein